VTMYIQKARTSAPINCSTTCIWKLNYRNCHHKVVMLYISLWSCSVYCINQPLHHNFVCDNKHVEGSRMIVSQNGHQEQLWNWSLARILDCLLRLLWQTEAVSQNILFHLQYWMITHIELSQIYSYELGVCSW
jgi:hypothetical protein